MAEQDASDPSPGAQPAKARKQTVVGLVLVGLGLCLQLPYFLPRATLDPCKYSSHDDDLFLQLLVLGIGLGVIGFAYIARGEGFYTGSLAPLTTIVAIVAVLFAKAAPTFILHYSERSPQSEARTNLSGIYVSEMAFYEEHKRYGTFEEIGVVFVGSHRYTYRIDRSGAPGTVIPPRHGGRRNTHSGPRDEPLTICPPAPDNTVVQAGISPDGQHFTATATGNLDWDTTIDQWHVNDAKQGLQQADVNDVTN